MEGLADVSDMPSKARRRSARMGDARIARAGGALGERSGERGWLRARRAKGISGGWLGLLDRARPNTLCLFVFFIALFT
jgi:hypothetical protein